jgi:hypothetical protein
MLAREAASSEKTYGAATPAQALSMTARRG